MPGRNDLKERKFTLAHRLGDTVVGKTLDWVSLWLKDLAVAS